jgi:hypothetical protein
MTREARAVSVRINRSAAEAYEFLSLPENFPKWASGLGASLRRSGDDWVVQTPEGPAIVRFSEHNAYGVLDHQVRLPRSGAVYVPLRVVAKGAGCDLVLTIFRRPEITDAQFAADAEWVLRDLEAAKQLLERSE